MRINLPVLKKIRSHKEKWEDCTLCKIGKRANKHVFYRGTLPCDVLFIGEAPGKNEDEQGKPFVGLSGKVLDAWIDYCSGIKFTYAITNLVACRPCDEVDGPNRPPTFKEQRRCADRLGEFTNIAKPKLVVLIGKLAHALEQYAPDHTLKLYHPAYILRNGGADGSMSRREAKKLRSFLKEKL